MKDLKGIFLTLFKGTFDEKSALWEVEFKDGKEFYTLGTTINAKGESEKIALYEVLSKHFGWFPVKPDKVSAKPGDLN